MVLGVVAALGVGLAGYGIFKGSKDAGRAANRVGRGAEQTLQTISREMTQMRVFLTETAWPEFNKTMTHFRQVLDSAEVLLVTSTFTVKVLALLLAVCAAFVIHKLTSERYNSSWRRRNNLTTLIDVTVLQILYCLCMVLAIVLVVQLVKELVHVSWLQSVPMVFIIPSVTTLVILYQHFVATLKAIVALLRFIPYVIVEVPINLGLDPVAKGSGYMRTILPLQLAMCTIYLLLYSLVPYAAYLLMAYLLKSEESVIKSILMGYAVFYAASMAISVFGAIIISYLIRPIWAFLVRRNLQRNYQ